MDSIQIKNPFSEKTIFKYHILGYYPKRYGRYIEIFDRTPGLGQDDHDRRDARAHRYRHRRHLRLRQSRAGFAAELAGVFCMGMEKTDTPGISWNDRICNYQPHRLPMARTCQLLDIRRRSRYTGRPAPRKGD